MFLAIVENEQVVKAGHISTVFPHVVFNSAPDQEFLAANNAYIVQTTRVYNPDTEYLETCDPYYENSTVYAVRVCANTAEHTAMLLASAWGNVKSQRQILMNRQNWRYERHAREVRMGLTPTDNIADLDNYFHALAEITNQPDPHNISWPEVPGTAAGD